MGEPHDHDAHGRERGVAAGIAFPVSGRAVPLGTIELEVDASELWATPAGGLVVARNTDGQYVSWDGGETFLDQAEQTVRGVRPVAGGFLAGMFIHHSATDRFDGALSEDGLTWRGFHIPEPGR